MKRLITLLFLFSALLSFGQRATKRVHELERETTLNNSYSLLVDSPEFLGLKRLDLLGLKTFFYNGLVAFESDPIFISWDKSTGISITESQISDLGNYLTEVPSIYVRRDLNENISANWAFAYAIREEGSLLTEKYAAKYHNHDSTYLTSFTETDSIFIAWNKSTGISITESQISDLGSYLTSFTESDPEYSSWNKSTGIIITESQIADLGNYLTSYSESDPNFVDWLQVHDINGDQMIDEAGQALNAAALSGHAGSYYLDYNNFTNIPTNTESDPVYSAWNKSIGISITESQISNLGNYLTSYSESDPNFVDWLQVQDVNGDQMIDEAGQALNAAALSGHAGSYYLDYNNFTNIPTNTESDPIYSAWNKSIGISITESQISNLGNYLTSYSESDPNFVDWLVVQDVNGDQMIDEAGQALNAAALSGHAGSYYLNYDNFTNVPTFTESDPVYSAWNKSTGISITESQISDLGSYLPLSGGSITGNIVVGNTVRDHGMFGTYDSYKTQHIWSMGIAYRNNAAGTNFGNLYGLAYKHTNNTTGGTMAGGHQMVWAQNGSPTSAMGTNLWTSGTVTASGGSSTNWNTAYSWGNHASANYLTSYSESDPNFAAWNKSTGISITESQISNLGSYLPLSGGAMTGNLTIKTTSSLLDIRALNESISSLRLSDNEALTSQMGRIEYNTSSSDALRFYVNNTTERMKINSAGITVTGTATATSFSGNGANITNVNATTVDGYNTNYTGTTAYTIPVHNGSGDLWARLFRSTYGEQTAAPISTADIAFRNSTSDNYIRFMTQSAMKTWMGIGQALLTSSNVTFGTVTAGNFYGLNFYLSSDRRLKENIKPLSGDLAYKLNPISHTWKNSNNLLEEVGFIADEVQKINSALVTTKPDGYDAVNYAKITAINNAAIQDLNTRLKAIEEKLTKLLEDK